MLNRHADHHGMEMVPEGSIPAGIIQSCPLPAQRDPAQPVLIDPARARMIAFCVGSACQCRAGMSFAEQPAMEKTDLYEILGIHPGATRKEVEAGYHRLISGSLEGEKRCLVERAYLVLSNIGKRTAYDRSRGYILHPGLGAGSAEKARTFFRRGKKAMETGMWKQASRAFRRAVVCQPWEAEYRSFLGLAMFYSGVNIHRARELCLEALMLDPSNTLCQKNLAIIYENIGLKKRAQRVLNHSGC